MTRLALAVLLAALPCMGTARADDPIQLSLTIKDHRWTPAELHVPSAKPIILTIRNDDPTPEEFDSTDLKVEKVIPGQYTATVRLRPLGPGRYSFMGEFHADTAQGAVIAQ